MSDETRRLGRNGARNGLPSLGPGYERGGPSAAGRVTQSLAHFSQLPLPVRLIKFSQYLVAVAILAAAIALAGLAASPSTSLYAKALLGTALGMLLVLVFLQRRGERQVLALSEQYRRAHQLAQLDAAVIAAFAMAIDAKDQHTHGHTERVCQIARLIGDEMDLNEDELQALETAAMLHDIGKLAVPDYILSKPDTLTQEELKKVRTHTLVGAAILEPVQFPWPVIPVIRSHHEWWDGSGYPDGLAGDQIPLAARILAVADVYDALLSHRPYRPAMTVQEAVASMRDHAGTQFDPTVLDTCFRVLASQQVHNQFGFIFDGNALSQRAQDSPVRRAIFMDIKQAHQELLALYEIVQTMGQSLSLQETLDLIISKTKRIIDFSTCVIFLYQPEEGQLKAVAASGPYADIILNRHLPMGSGVSGAVAEKAIASGLGRSAADDLILLLGPTARSCALTEVLSAPLGREPAAAVAGAATRGDLVGALTLYRASDRPFTEDDARLIAAVVRQASVAVNNARQYEQTRQSALTDQLTGLANARYFFMHLEQELSRARREKIPVSLIAIDLNNLKQINDTFGHQTGDRALRLLAEVFKTHVRDYDTVVRYAGDEFFIILPDAANQKAVETANRIKRAVRDTVFEAAPGRTATLGASLGVATFPGDAKEADALIAVADRAMYSDKHLSRQAAQLTHTIAPQPAGEAPVPAEPSTQPVQPAWQPPPRGDPPPAEELADQPAAAPQPSTAAVGGIQGIAAKIPSRAGRRQGAKGLLR